MKIEFDPNKRLRTLEERDVDFADAILVFEGIGLTERDHRIDYGEERFITVGWLREVLVVLVWTPRGDARRIISMRKANDREKARFGHRLGQG